MARKTTPTEFQHLLEVIRRKLPDAAITTDVIVGFPGEDDMEYEESLDFVRAMHFAGGHVFSYSTRPGTAAVRLPGHVPSQVRKERSERMRSVLSAAAHEYQRRFLNQRVEVLWEGADQLGPDGWCLLGMTDNYLKVTATAPARLWNQISPVQLLRIDGDRIEGKILRAA
jgi:threonylcarbamoyladenosine tRNA methylthiotransferase MtaB